MNDNATTTSTATTTKPNTLMISVLFGVLAMGGGWTLAPSQAAPGCAPAPPAATAATHPQG